MTDIIKHINEVAGRMEKMIKESTPSEKKSIKIEKDKKK